MSVLKQAGASNIFKLKLMIKSKANWAQLEEDHGFCDQIFILQSEFVRYIIKLELMSAKTIFLLSRSLNLITGVGLIVLGIFSIINILNLVTIQFFLIPSPVFVILFGIFLLGAEFKVKFIIKNAPFLNSYIGRGIFNIYLSSVAFWFLVEHIVAAWIAGMILFVTGILYIVFHMGWSKELKEFQEKDNPTDKAEYKQQKNPIRENFF